MIYKLYYNCIVMYDLYIFAQYNSSSSSSLELSYCGSSSTILSWSRNKIDTATAWRGYRGESFQHIREIYRRVFSLSSSFYDASSQKVLTLDKNVKRPFLCKIKLPFLFI